MSAATFGGHGMNLSTIGFYILIVFSSAEVFAMRVLPEPQIISKLEINYIGIEISHRPGDDKPGQLWANFSKRMGEIRNISGPAVGIAGNFQANGTATYAAARQVSDTSFVPPGMKILVSPSGEYADFTIVGPISQLFESLDYIYGKWIPKNGYKTNGAGIEVYPENSDVDSPDFELHLLVPLEL